VLLLLSQNCPKYWIKERKKPEKFMLPHGRPSDDRSFAFSSRVPSKAAKIKALINYGIIRIVTEGKVGGIS
jgi:hypothetical protein